MSESIGKKLFITRCAPCHSMEEGAKHKVGPNLFNFFDKRSCTAEGYTYSEALINKAFTWDEHTLSEYIEDPRKKVPGTRMLFAGLKKPQEREDLIAYIKKVSK